MALSSTAQALNATTFGESTLGVHNAVRRNPLKSPDELTR